MTRKIVLKEPDRKKYYSLRGGDNLTKLKQWIIWAKKKYPGQKMIIVNNYKIKMAEAINKGLKEYWKMRFNSPAEDKYTIWRSY